MNQSERRQQLIDQFPSQCRAAGLYLTPQRQAIYAALARSLEHPSAEQIHRKLAPGYPSLSLATVYKTMETLEQAGLVSLVNVVHESARYDAETGLHHHLVCERCKRVEDVHDASLDGLQTPVADDVGFLVRQHSVHFFGLCATCAKPSSSKPRKPKSPRRS